MSVILRETVFVTEDGKRFNTYSEAFSHMQQLEKDAKENEHKMIENYFKYYNHNNYKRTDRGYFLIKNPEKSSDEAGYKDKEVFAIYKGTFLGALKYALTFDIFHDGLGGYGEISMVENFAIGE